MTSSSTSSNVVFSGLQQTDRPAAWVLGIVSLSLGAAIPPILRFVPLEPSKDDDHKREATDLGESSRVC